MDLSRTKWLKNGHGKNHSFPLKFKTEPSFEIQFEQLIDFEDDIVDGKIWPELSIVEKDDKYMIELTPWISSFSCHHNVKK